MIWDDTGFLLSKNRYSENSLIAEIYTKDHGKVSGLIQKKLRTIFRSEIIYMLILIQNQKIGLDILKLKFNKLFHQFILMIIKNYHVFH